MLKFNDFERATKYLLQGLMLNRRSKNKTGLTIALNNLGELNLSLNKSILAEQQLQEAGELAKSINNKPELLRYYKLMKELDSAKKRFDRAFIWQREYFDLKNSLESKNVIKDSLLNGELEISPEFDPNFSNSKSIETEDSSMAEKDNEIKIN